MSCIVKNCKSNWKMWKVSFHCVPKACPDNWLKALNIPRKNWEWGKNKRVCSKHFEDSCFDKTGQTIRLKAGSVPTLNLPMPESSSHTDTIAEADTTCESIKMEVDRVYQEEEEHSVTTGEDTQELMPCPSTSSYKLNRQFKMRSAMDSTDVPWSGVHRCKLCNYRTRFLRNLLSHMRQHSTKSKDHRFTCHLCFLEKYECEECQFQSDLKIILTNHLYRAHKLEEARFENPMLKYCGNCDFQTYSSLILLGHYCSG